jgi:hypothetical protein
MRSATSKQAAACLRYSAALFSRSPIAGKTPELTCGFTQNQRGHWLFQKGPVTMETGQYPRVHKNRSRTEHVSETSSPLGPWSASGRFCCRSRLRGPPNSDSVVVMRTPTGAPDDGVEEAGSRAAVLFV